MGIIDYIEQRNRERVMRARLEDSKKVGFGLVLGLAVGAGIGLLTAPKSGEETRKDLMKAAKDASDIVKEKAGEYAGMARDFGVDVESHLTSIGPALEKGFQAAGDSYKKNREENRKELDKNGEALVDKAADTAKEVAKGAGKVKEDVKNAAKEVKKDVKETAEKAGK